MSGCITGFKRRRGGKDLLKERIIIFSGSFGSGKTEIAINQSYTALQNNEKVVIVDLDIVNPYFRTRDMKEKLKESGIKVITPPDKFALSDLPLISPEIKGFIQNDKYKLIIDVGGDEIGAKSLANFYTVLRDTDYKMHMVINPFRPFTNSINQIQNMLENIELFSRLKINSLISNPHLGDQTNLNLIKKGHNIVKEVSNQLNIPITYLVMEKSLYQRIGHNNFTEKILIIQRYLVLPWD